jgi:hypothetical protein
MKNNGKKKKKKKKKKKGTKVKTKRIREQI